MRNVDGLNKLAAAVLLAVFWSMGARAGPADSTARALVSAWKDADPSMAKVAEVIASAFASGMSWAGTIEGHPVYCPPPGPLTGNEIMNILERFTSDHPDAADRTYGFALRELEPSVPLHAGLNELLGKSRVRESSRSSFCLVTPLWL